MSCPDWRALVAARDAAPAADLPAWDEARRHASTCGSCREAAFAADPLLLFSRLPERRVTPGEIDDMQSAVAALVRSSRIAQSARVEPSGKDRVSARLPLSRVAAALGICSLLALSGAPRRHPSGFAELEGAGSAVAKQRMTAAEVQAFGSVVEELDRPGARIYELPQADMAVVMIVDASLDV